MRKKSLLILLLTWTTLILSGCSSFENEGSFFHDYFVSPFTYLIKYLGEIFHGNYGVVIILITLAVRLLLLPLAIRMAKKQQVMREKMELIKPEIETIQRRLKQAKTKEEQMQLQQERMAVYKKYDYNPFNIGCLPMLIQLPIWTGLFYAIRLSPEISGTSFLWFNLGTPDIILGVLAATSYYFQFQVSLYNVPEEQKQQMKFMGLMSPAMILLASLSTASALALYWFISGCFLIGQTLLTKKLFGPQTVPGGSSSGAQTKKAKK